VPNKKIRRPPVPLKTEEFSNLATNEHSIFQPPAIPSAHQSVPTNHNNTTSDTTERTLFITGIPDAWHDNFFVKKKVMNAIKNKFLTLTIDDLKKDVKSGLWKLTVKTEDDYKNVLGQSLEIEESQGKEKKYKLEFIVH